MHTPKRLVAAFGLPLVIGLLAFAPLAYAQSDTFTSTGTSSSCTTTTSITNLGDFFQTAICIIDSFIVPLVFAIAFIVFIIGIYRYFIQGATNQEKRQEGQQLLVYGLIGFFIMFAVWGLINLLLGTFSFGNSSRPCYPTFGSSNTQTNCNGSSSTNNTTSSGNLQNI